MILIILVIPADSKLTPAQVLEQELETILRVAKRLTLNEADAEDVVSQTIIIAFQKWESFDGRHPRSWLIQIMRNEWLQNLRKRKSRPETELVEAAEEGFWREVDSRLEAQFIYKALDDLGEDFRIAITLCDLEGLSYQEAAQIVDVPLGTFQSRLFRARKQLRSRVLELSGEPA